MADGLERLDGDNDLGTFTAEEIRRNRRVIELAAPRRGDGRTKQQILREQQRLAALARAARRGY